jgi:hypothetical protein
MKSSRKFSAKALTFAVSVRLRLDVEAIVRAYREAPVESFPIPERFIPSEDDLADLADVDPELFRQRPDPSSASRRGQKIAVEKRREKAKVVYEFLASAHRKDPTLGAKKLAHAAREQFRLSKPNATPEDLKLFTQPRAVAVLRQENARLSEQLQFGVGAADPEHSAPAREAVQWTPL